MNAVAAAVLAAAALLTTQPAFAEAAAPSTSSAPVPTVYFGNGCFCESPLWQLAAERAVCLAAQSDVQLQGVRLHSLSLSFLLQLAHAPPRPAPPGGRQKDFVDAEQALGRTTPADISALVGYAGGQVCLLTAERCQRLSNVETAQGETLFQGLLC
jgi:hypothetical protein